MIAHVIGAGLAGSEAAWQLAQKGVYVQLWEMRPHRMTPAHQTGELAELVCSNSLGSHLLTAAGGLLKAELDTLGSFILRCAQASAVPAGGALAVDRKRFSRRVSDMVGAHPRIRIRREECCAIPQGDAVVFATGPLTSPAMSEQLKKLTGAQHLYFYDAAAPIVDGESVDYEYGFWGARYGKGTADYFNCPMDEEEYNAFYESLIHADTVPLHEGVEDLKVFEGCMPIEVMAQRGRDTLRYGPLRPVGLTAPGGQRPYAVLQLRRENESGSLLNLVGFQTRLKWGEQRRVFRKIPALHRAEFHRYGVMHRNTFMNAPQVLNHGFQFRSNPRLFAAGQVTGVEGYAESAASGLMAAMQALRFLCGQELLTFPETSIMGALANHVCTPTRDYQPMAANFGILPPLSERIRNKQRRKEAYSQRSLASLSSLRDLYEY